MRNNLSGWATFETIETMASRLEEIAGQFRRVADAMRGRGVSKIECGDTTSIGAAIASLQEHGEEVCRQLLEF